jgi:hypothetical protein
MDILQRLKNFRENNEFNDPWNYGFNSDKASVEAGIVWATLTIEERLAVSRENPFRSGRNKILRSLKKAGITMRILAELSGLSMAAVEKITILKEIKL